MLQNNNYLIPVYLSYSPIQFWKFTLKLNGIKYFDRNTSYFFLNFVYKLQNKMLDFELYIFYTKTPDTVSPFYQRSVRLPVRDRIVAWLWAFDCSGLVTMTPAVFWQLWFVDLINLLLIDKQIDLRFDFLFSILLQKGTLCQYVSVHLIIVTVSK